MENLDHADWYYEIKEAKIPSGLIDGRYYWVLYDGDWIITKYLDGFLYFVDTDHSACNHVTAIDLREIPAHEI